MEMLSDFPLYLRDMLYSHVLFCFELVILVMSALVRYGLSSLCGAARTLCT
jgi:hypothetical protein